MTVSTQMCAMMALRDVLSPNTAETEILQAAKAGAIVVCANERTRRRMLRLYEAMQEGRGAWLSPDMITLDGLVSRVWQEHSLEPSASALPVLNAVQEAAVWEQIIRNNLRDASDAGRSAAAAREAWKLLYIYEAESDGMLKGTAVQKLGHAFEIACERLGVTHRGRTAREATSLLAAEDRSVWVGFDTLTPQQERLFRAMQPAGARRISVHQSLANNIKRHEFADSRQEMQAAARWARAILENQTEARIGIVAPALNPLRGLMERIFLEELEPEALLTGAGPRTFEISLGAPLSEWPLTRAALDLLRWTVSPLSIGDAGSLIRGPWLRESDAESGRRALLDREMRRWSGREVSAREVRSCAARKREGVPAGFACPELVRVMYAIEDFDHSAKSASAWAEQMTGLLRKCGWPGERELSSPEYQTANRWREMLSAIATLDAIEGEISAEDIVAKTQATAEEWFFQPEKIDAPVQIMGHLEASGERFTHLWMLGMDEESWPVRAASNALIPAALRRKCRMPGSSVEVDEAFATAVTERLRKSADEVVVSSARSRGESALRPSALISEIELRNADASPGWVQPLYVAQTQAFEESALPTGEEVQHGGSNIFKLQAECPFKAFAKIRLRADALEQPEDGVTARERGTLVHECLRSVWSELRSSERLKKMPAAERSALVNKCVREAAEGRAHRDADAWQQAISELESERTAGIVMQWLEWEERRADFEVMEADSEERTVEFGGVSARVRRDRVDKLRDGRLVVIDYKTGEVKKTGWDGPRPDQPQLPIYAASSEGEVAGVLFAQLKAGDLKFVGECAERDIVPGMKGSSREELEMRISQWRDVLTNLGHEFRAGEISVDPKDEQKTCAKCECKPVCRIREVKSSVEDAW